MINIVIDTNVVLSSLLSNKGASFKLMSLIHKRKFKINISTPLIYEYEEILKAKSDFSDDEIDQYINFICKVANKNKIFYLWRPKLKDPDDDFLLELAVKSNSHIVTLNPKDFSNAKQFDFKIISPKEFLQMIGEIK